MKKLVALILSVVLLAGCTNSSPMEEQVALDGMSNNANQEKISVDWPPCDTEEVSPLTQIVDKDLRVFASNCATDRTTPANALPAADLTTSNLEACMLEERSFSRNTYGDYIIGGFPRAVVAGNWPAQIELTMVVVPMDWPDFRGKESPLEQISPAVEFTENFYRVFSRGKVTFNWRIYDEWITAPDESSNYYVSQEEMQDQHGKMRQKAEIYFPKVIEFTDPFVDYSDADLVLYVWPEEQDLFTQYIMWDSGENGVGPFMSDEGLVKQAFTGGRFHFESGHGGLGPFWAHEMGHAFGLPDLNWSMNDYGTNLPGSFNGYDLMAGFDATRTLSSWLMFLADWLGPNEIYCLSPEDFTGASFELFPVTNTSDNLKSIMIPINERFQIVVESRRISEFDVASASKTRSREGVIVYLVDSTKGQGEGTQIILAPQGRGLYKYSIGNYWRTDQLDAMFYEGNTIDVAGYRITVNEFQIDRDIVSVQKIGPEETQFGNFVCITEENRDRSRIYEEYCPLEALLKGPSIAITGESMDPSICKLQEDSSQTREYPQHRLASSFPPVGNLSLPIIGDINVKLVFIEWGNLQGTREDYDYNVTSAKIFSDFYHVMSEGNLNLDISAEANWINVGANWERDKIPEGMEGGSGESKAYLEPVIRRIVKAVDPVIDFTDVDLILFGLPSAENPIDGLHIFGRHGPAAVTQEGTIGDMFSLGQRVYEHRDELPGWKQFAHEFGHSIGLPDLRDWSNGLQERGRTEYLMYLINPMYGFEMMDNQNAGTQTISGWLKWVQGWLDDNQVTCTEVSSVEGETFLINESNQIGAEAELLVVRLSDTKALVVESRRWDERFDFPVQNSIDGVIVYTVDAELGHSEGPLKLLSPRDKSQYLSQDNVWPDWRVLDVVLFEGDSVEFDGVQISVEHSGRNFDIVRVSKS